MNLFVFNSNPIIAAEQACDAHVIKICTEAAQMLSWAALSHGAKPNGFYGIPPSSKKHPVTLWVCQNSSNYRWTWEYAMALCNEYTKRFGKIHETSKVLARLEDCCSLLQNKKLTPFVQDMPKQYMQHNNAPFAYQIYFLSEKMSIAKWTNTQPPSWFLNHIK
jgi:hypothetical protein